MKVGLLDSETERMLVMGSVFHNGAVNAVLEALAASIFAHCVARASEAN